MSHFGVIFLKVTHMTCILNEGTACLSMDSQIFVTGLSQELTLIDIGLETHWGMLLRIFLTKSVLVICVRLLLHLTVESLYILREPTLAPNLVMHTSYLPDSWIFRFCEEYP